MKTSVRRAVLLLLACALFLTVALPAFAATPGTADPQACIHSKVTMISSIYNAHRYYNSSYCKGCFTITYQCDNCGASFTNPVWVDGTETVHTETLYNATCNGTTQTWYYHCKYCSGNITTAQIACPRPHPNNGSCSWLPI